MEWRPIEGYKFPYRISETARLQKFYKGKWVEVDTKFYGGSHDRLEACMRTADSKKRIVGINTLMANAFLGGCKPGYKVIHKNGMKTDCALENLAFASQKEIGKKYGGIGRRKSVLKVDKNGNLLAVYHTAGEAAKRNFMSETQVRKHCRGIVQNPFKFLDYTFVYDKE